MRSITPAASSHRLEGFQTMHTHNSADLPADIAELVYTELPNGQGAWLRPAGPVDRYRLTERVVIVDQPDTDRFWITQKGREAIAS
jgi:hypothetical protein